MFGKKSKPSQNDLQNTFTLNTQTVHGYKTNPTAIIRRMNELKAELKMLECIDQADEMLTLETENPYEEIKLQKTTMAGVDCIRMIRVEK